MLQQNINFDFPEIDRPHDIALSKAMFQLGPAMRNGKREEILRVLEDILATPGLTPLSTYQRRFQEMYDETLSST